MRKANTAVAYDLEQAKALLEQVAKRLSAKPWFKDTWLVSVHYYPPEPAAAESVTMHVFKAHWFNDSKQGIHFETHLSARQLSDSSVQVMLHLFHTDTVPGTTIKRIKVSKPFVDEAFDLISGWNGYVFRAGKYGTQPFACTVKFAPDTLVDQLENEFSRLCTQLGPRIDSVLHAVL